MDPEDNQTRVSWKILTYLDIDIIVVDDQHVEVILFRFLRHVRREVGHILPHHWWRLGSLGQGEGIRQAASALSTGEWTNDIILLRRRSLRASFIDPLQGLDDLPRTDTIRLSAWDCRLVTG